MILGMKLAVGLMLSAMALAQEIPTGTVVPIRLSTGLNAEKDTAGKKIAGQVMQDVPLPAQAKLNARSRVNGHVVRVTKPGPSGASIVIRFDTIEDGGHSIPLTASLLAVAAAASVDQAQNPINSTANIDPTSIWVTRQVGGDIVNRGRGKAGSAGGAMGTWLEGSSVMIRLTPNPEAGCPSGAGYDREQAVWVFSSAACGTYGLGHTKIEKSGGSSSLGEIVLRSAKNIAIQPGSGWLLMVAAGE